MEKNIISLKGLKSVSIVALVAGIYFALTLAGQLLTLSPDNAPPIWPAAGFALGALFLWGVRYWPGIWLGALAYGLWRGEGVMLSALLALGPVLQALAGFWLTRRLVLVAKLRQLEGDVLRFVLLAGPVACLISASWSVVAHYAAGSLPQGQLVWQWILYWSRDTLGVLLFMPMLVLFLPGAAWYRGRRIVRIALPLLVFAVAVVAVFIWHDSQNRADRVERAETAMNDIYEQEIQELPSLLWGIEAIERFFYARKAITRDEFITFAAPLQYRPGVQVLAWLPRISAERRAEFEATLVQEVIGAGMILEQTAAGQLLQAKDRAEYFPMHYAVPSELGMAPIGRNFGNAPRHRAAMARARDEGMVVSVKEEVSRQKQRHEIHVFLPIYRKGFDFMKASVDERRRELTGYVMSIIDLETMMVAMVEAAKNKGLLLRVIDDGEELITFKGTPAPDAKFIWRRDLNLIEHKLQLEMQPAAVSWQNGHTASEAMYRLASVLTVLLLCYGTLVAAGRSELLATRERRFRAIFEQNGVGIVQTDPANGRILLANQHFGKMLGYSTEEMTSKTWRELSFPEDRAKHKGMLERIRRGEIEGYALETRLLTASGARLWVSANASLVRDEDGQPLYGQLVVEDITERKLMHDALESLNTSLSGKAFYDHLVGQIALLLDAEIAFIVEVRNVSNASVRAAVVDGKLMSPVWEYGDIVGAPGADVIGKAYCCYPDGLQQRFPDFSAAVRLGVVSYAAMPLWDSHGQPAGLIGIMSRRPIVQPEAVAGVLRLMSMRVGNELEREAQQRVLQESEAKFLRLVGSLENTFMFYSHDVAGDNLRILGQTEEKIWRDGIASPDLSAHLTDNPINAQVPQHKAAVLRGRGVPVTYELETWHADGSRRMYEVTEVAVIGNDGNVSSVEGISHDITQRKENEEELRRLTVQLENRVEERTYDLAAANNLIGRREREIRSLLDNLGEGVLQIDSHGIVQLSNPAIENILGYKPEELIGRNISILMPEPDKSAHDSYLERYLLTSKAHILGSTSREVVGLHKDGRLIDLDLVVNEYRVHDEIHFTGILRDISERQRVMAELRQARMDAEAANQAKSAFLATMSHEIRTPMNGVIGTLDVLRRASLKPHQAELANIIGDSAMSLLTIIDDILDFSKIEAGKLVLEREPLLLVRAVEGACDALQPIAMRQQVTLAVYIDPLLPDWVLGDGVRLRQIINNLLGNAIKFCSKQEQPGRVKLRVAASGPKQMRITIADNGIGIAPEVQKKLFSPFTQAEASTTRRFGGTGLGLTICRRLVDLMGGDIKVDSTPGQGATFIVTLPLEPDTAQPSRAPAHDLSGLDCCIVTWDADQGHDWASYLCHAGARVTHEADWETAARQLPLMAPVRGVLILENPPAGVVPAGLAAQPDTGMVVIANGRRRNPRMENGIVSLDGNAMHRASLIQAVAVAAGRSEMADEDEPEIAAQANALAPLSVEQAAAQGRLILVAEDNDINQKVILRQLALLGYTAEIAEDGRQALNRWRGGRYALLLTDLHMPEMDGYELTAAIRREERLGEHLPIVALTANALKGEDVHCKEVGMDDYLSKPVQLDWLQTMLEKWMPLAGAASVATISQSTVEPAPAKMTHAVLDTAVLAKLVGDDAAMIAEFLDDYRVSLDKSAEEIRSALTQCDWKAAGAVAHKLKSSSRSVGALALGEVCARLELAGKEDNADEVRELAPEFENALAAVTAALNRR